MSGTVLDACLQLGFLDDPAQVIRIAGGDGVIALATATPPPDRKILRSATAF
jgi:hypothetical protein